MPRDRTWLSETEELALGLVLSDPNAGERGAWLYPLHNDLTQRGCTQAQATLALNGLTAKGLLQFVDSLPAGIADDLREQRSDRLPFANDRFGMGGEQRNHGGGRRHMAAVA